jgi:phenylalanyl-tRNA synthetase alpha chain
MKEYIDELAGQIEAYSITNTATLEEFRIHFLGSKGVVKELFSSLKTVPNEEKKEVGRLLNDLKIKAESKLELFKEQLASQQTTSERIDLSRPAEESGIGAHHPLSLVRNEIISIFSRIGYEVSEGPEIEDDWHNFSALNFPPEHPARDMQDTFLKRVKKKWHFVHTQARSKCELWKIALRQFARYHQEGCTATRPFLLVRIASFIKWKACTSIKMYPSRT